MFIFLKQSSRKEDIGTAQLQLGPNVTLREIFRGRGYEIKRHLAKWLYGSTVIRNWELMRQCFPQHSRRRTATHPPSPTRQKVYSNTVNYCTGIGLLVHNYFQFFAPNTHCAFVVALSGKSKYDSVWLQEMGNSCKSVFPYTRAWDTHVKS